MKLIIDVDEKLVCEGFERHFTEEEKDILIRAIGHGTPLPKGHGRLKDIDEVERRLDLDEPDNVIAKALKNIIESVPTIVEAE